MLCHTLGAERDFLVLVLLCVSSECLEIKLGMHALQKAFIKNMVRSMEIPLFGRAKAFRLLESMRLAVSKPVFSSSPSGVCFIKAWDPMVPAYFKRLCTPLTFKGRAGPTCFLRDLRTAGQKDFSAGSIENPQ